MSAPFGSSIGARRPGRAVFGWGVAVAAIIVGLLAGRTRWRHGTAIEDVDADQEREDAA